MKIKMNFLYSSLHWMQDGTNYNAMLLSVHFFFQVVVGDALS